MDKKIIIVEDDPFSIEYYRFIFTKSGHKFLALNSTEQLLAELEHDSVSLVIMDINLKNMYLEGKRVDGVKLTRVIKNNTKWAHIPVLVVSASSLRDDGNDLMVESKGDRFVSKPIVDIDNFIRLVDEMIYGR